MDRPVRVLVVEDFEPFRRIVVSLLQQQLELQVIGEVSDGLEAVQKAQELQPDLILMDIGLPKLNGIEAAEWIRKLSPRSKILIVSQETSADVAQTVFAVGASGYVIKADAVGELLTAVKALVQSEKFVSSRFSGHNFADAMQSQFSDTLRRGEVPAWPAPTVPSKTTRRHEAGFYSDDASFLDGFTHFIAAALSAGDVAIVVATESHRNSLLQRLQAHGVNVPAAIEDGQYVSLDAAATLSTFMDGGLANPTRFLKVANDLVRSAASTANGGLRHVAACGECAPLLLAEGNAKAALRVEQLWDEIARTHGVDILCGYSQHSFGNEIGSRVFQQICSEHSAVHSW